MIWDAAIAGGGPAGAATAAALAEAGRRVVLIERSAAAQHKVCGEFLSGEAAALLARLGLTPEGLGARPIARMRLSAAGFVAETTLPFPAWSLGRDVLDAALLAAAEARGALIRRGRSVTRLEAGTAMLGDERIAAGNIVLATGKHDLRGQVRTGKGMLAFKQYWRLAPAQARALEDHVEVHVFPDGYAGLQPAAAAANLCLVVEPGTYARLGRSWPALLGHIVQGSPLLGRRLAGAEPVWERPVAVAGQPYGFLADRGALHRVGDQLAVIHSFCGEGIVIALDSGLATAERIVAGAPPLQGARYRRQVNTAQAAARLLRAPGLVVGMLAAVPGLLTALARATRVGAIAAG